MELLPDLLNYGAIGLLAGILLWLYLQERSDHAKTRQLLIDSKDERIADSKTSVSQVTDALSGLTLGVQAMSAKIEVSKGRN